MSKTEQEALDLVNKKDNSRPDNWKWYKDVKKFGWGCGYKKNWACKKFGISQGKEHRKDIRKFISLIRHKMLKHIPLTEEEINKSRYCWEISDEVRWHIRNFKGS